VNRGQAAFAAAGVAAVAVLAWLVRALPWATVFHRGEVIFAPGDAMYHARRAFVTFERFPSALLWDPYVNYPDGAPIPWPPLFDWVTGSVAWLLVGDVHGFEAVMAWAPPLIGALTVVPIYFTSREIAGRATSLAAGVFFALLPISVVYGRVGNPDHHCAVALVGATLLLVVVKLVSPRAEGRRLIALGAALAGVRLVLLLTWHGSLLYLVLAEAVLLVSAALLRRPALFVAQSLGAAATAAALAGVLAGFPEPLGGLYSSIAPSRLHVLALAGVAFVAGIAGWREQRAYPQSTLPVRLGWIAAASALFAAGVLALPGPREGLVPALQFLSMGDGVGARTAEQFPLFSMFGRRAGGNALHVWGYFAYLLPLAPLGPWLFARRPECRAQALAIGAWALFLGALAFSQRRYGNDAAAAVAISLALWGAAVVRLLRARLRLRDSLAAALVAAFALALFAPPITDLYTPWARRSYAKLSGVPGYDRAPLPTAAWSLHRFARSVRAVTPETSAYLADPSESGVAPEYGVVSHANLGHALQWVARRPTPTDPFWAYIGPQNWERAFGLLAARSEARALELAAELRARFVVTVPGGNPGTLTERLHEGDGLRDKGTPRLARFRLVTEGPKDGVPLAAIFDHSPASTSSIPYKLFEIVKGAVLVVSASPGSLVEASVGLVTPAQRTLRYVARAKAGEDGRARLRVPYSNAAPSGSDDALRVRVDRRWRVRVGNGGSWEQREVVVPESAVLSGEHIAVHPRQPAGAHP
jgi:dolichyl-diphosphooligosaccharide--protein glycosyltransferase